MTSSVLTRPDDPTALSGWLEWQLIGPDLDRLVAELAVVNRAPPTIPLLEEVLGIHAPRVLASGLAALPRSTLSLLLLNPDLLPELRDLVLTEGGTYWDRIAADDGLATIGERVAQRVRHEIGPGPVVNPRRTLPRWVGHASTAFATAAAVLVAVYLAGGMRKPDKDVVGVQGRAPGGNWGFCKVQEIPRDGTDAANLTALGDLAGEWSKKRPGTGVDLAIRLTEFRQGCATLQLTDLPLSAPQQRWVKLQCREWAAEIDGHLKRLEETGDTDAVRAAADNTVARIVDDLKRRAHG